MAVELTTYRVLEQELHQFVCFQLLRIFTIGSLQGQTRIEVGAQIFLNPRLYTRESRHRYYEV